MRSVYFMCYSTYGIRIDLLTMQVRVYVTICTVI